MKKHIKFLIISVIILFIIFTTLAVVFGLFTDRKEDEMQIRIGDINVILLEDWPDDVDDIGIEKNTKIVKGKSVAEKKAYVRLRFIPVVEYFYEGTENESNIAEWRTAPISQDSINLKFEGEENWIRQGQYFYYKNILLPQQETEELKVKWDVIEVPKGLSNYEKVRVNVKVLLEYAQSTNELWKEIFQIENLPEGVER